MRPLIYRNDSGRLVCDEPIVITCGCGSVVPNARTALRNAGVKVPMISSSNNVLAREYMHQQGLDVLVPSVTKNKHAIIYNPRNGYFVDMYKALLTQEYYENLREAAA